MSYCWVQVVQGWGASRVRVDQWGTPGCGLTCYRPRIPRLDLISLGLLL